jgi:hypothetical protein
MGSCSLPKLLMAGNRRVVTAASPNRPSEAAKADTSGLLIRFGMYVRSRGLSIDPPGGQRSQPGGGGPDQGGPTLLNMGDRPQAFRGGAGSILSNLDGLGIPMRLEAMEFNLSQRRASGGISCRSRCQC